MSDPFNGNETRYHCTPGASSANKGTVEKKKSLFPEIVTQLLYITNSMVSSVTETLSQSFIKSFNKTNFAFTIGENDSACDNMLEKQVVLLG